MQVPYTWNLTAPIAESDRVITVYGINSEADARKIADRILASGLVLQVEMKKSWKESRHSPWKVETLILGV